MTRTAAAKPYRCPVCQKGFATPQAAASHTTAKHGAEASQPPPPACDYCRQPSVFHASSAAFYRGRDYGPLWACVPCQAWVGCHPGTATPLGRLANAALRSAKSKAHALFDPIWKNGWATRGYAYKRLAMALGIPQNQCHIGMMDLEQCAAVVEAVRVLGPAMMAEHKAKHAPAPTGAARPAMLVSLTEATHG